jgi:hypothetical protein
VRQSLADDKLNFIGLLINNVALPYIDTIVSLMANANLGLKESDERGFRCFIVTAGQQHGIVDPSASRTPSIFARVKI